MQLNLVPHPTTPPADPPFKVWASVDHAAKLGTSATTNIWFGVGAPADRFLVPQSPEPARTAELWRTTCFEAFLRANGDREYCEWNFAPSGDWAAFVFDDYRQGMADAQAGEPYIRMEDNMTWWALGATIAIPAHPEWALGLSAILEEKDGTKSYWALAHSNAERPDFHLADCFTATLA